MLVNVLIINRFKAKLALKQGYLPSRNLKALRYSAGSKFAGNSSSKFKLKILKTRIALNSSR